MKRLTIPALAIVVLAAAAIMLRSPSAPVNISAGTAAMPSLLELHNMAGVDKLPAQEMEDQSLVYSAQQKR
ncbi:hypothetical protein [Bradyrhizobium genosp. P]|uniref:hypothetical protein n=1 Tax=Bradyrhizobium genosp. P TaxID=83641 RepID=UPI003CFA4A72